MDDEVLGKSIPSKVRFKSSFLGRTHGKSNDSGRKKMNDTFGTLRETLIHARGLPQAPSLKPIVHGTILPIQGGPEDNA